MARRPECRCQQDTDAEGGVGVDTTGRLEWNEIDCVFVGGDEIGRQLQEIAENLHLAELTALERDEHVSKWIELTESKQRILSQVDSKFKRGRPEGSIRSAARVLGLPQPNANRAIKVASLSEEAKQTVCN